MIADSLRFTGRVAAVANLADLITGDNTADYRSAPVIIRADQSSGAVVQFQGGISQCIGNVIGRCTELWTYGTNNYPLWASPLNNEPANHHVVARLHKGTAC